MGELLAAVGAKGRDQGDEAAGSGEHARMHDCHWLPTLFLDFRFSMAELLSLERLR